MHQEEKEIAGIILFIAIALSVGLGSGMETNPSFWINPIAWCGLVIVPLLLGLWLSLSRSASPWIFKIQKVDLKNYFTRGMVSTLVRKPRLWWTITTIFVQVIKNRKDK